MGDITLRKALDDYKTIYMPYRNFAKRTRIEYLNDLEDLVRFLEKSGVKTVKDLELSQIERYLAELEKRGFADVTRKRKTVTIRSFLKFLYQDQYIDSNLAKRIIPPFIDNKMPTYMTEAEINRLRMACAANVRDTAIVELLLQTGIRLSELTHLILNDIELKEKGGVIRIRGNRGKEARILPLNSKASHALYEYLSQRPDTENSFLFLNRFGEPLGNRGVQKMLMKYLSVASIIGASIHSLRHTFGICQAVKGTRLINIQEAMGLKEIRSALIYHNLANIMINKVL